VARYNIPVNIHLAVSPIHSYTADEFVKDSEAAAEAARGKKTEVKLEEVLRDVVAGKVDSSVVPILVDILDPEFAVSLVKQLVVEMYNEKGACPSWVRRRHFCLPVYLGYVLSCGHLCS
jgi:hypothetical protein